VRIRFGLKGGEVEESLVDNIAAAMMTDTTTVTISWDFLS
jgi:hypothetical protein